MAEQTPKPEGLQERLIRRAWEEEAFRRALVADPKAAIEAALGVELPGEMEIQVVEETPHKIWLVLPAPPEAQKEGELSDRELEAVAGGVYTPTMARYTDVGFGRLGVITVTLGARRTSPSF